MAIHYRPRGKGSVSRRGARWIARGPSEGGRATWIGSFETRREAERALEAWLASRARGLTVHRDDR